MAKPEVEKHLGRQLEEQDVENLGNAEANAGAVRSISLQRAESGRSVLA